MTARLHGGSRRGVRRARRLEARARALRRRAARAARDPSRPPARRSPAIRRTRSSRCSTCFPTLEALAGLPRSRAAARRSEACSTPAAWRRDGLPAGDDADRRRAARGRRARRDQALLLRPARDARNPGSRRTDPAGSRLARRLPRDLSRGSDRFDLAADPGETRLPADRPRAPSAPTGAPVERAIAHTRRGVELARGRERGPLATVRGRGILRRRGARAVRARRERPLLLEPRQSGSALDARARPLRRGRRLPTRRRRDRPDLRIDLPGDRGRSARELRLAGARPVRLASVTVPRVPRAADSRRRSRSSRRPTGAPASSSGEPRARRAPARPKRRRRPGEKLRALGYLH